jgi:hypothetical protein
MVILESRVSYVSISIEKATPGNAPVLQKHHLASSVY